MRMPDSAGSGRLASQRIGAGPVSAAG